MIQIFVNKVSDKCMINNWDLFSSKDLLFSIDPDMSLRHEHKIPASYCVQSCLHGINKLSLLCLPPVQPLLSPKYSSDQDLYIRRRTRHPRSRQRKQIPIPRQSNPRITRHRHRKSAPRFQRRQRNPSLICVDRMRRTRDPNQSKRRHRRSTSNRDRYLRTWSDDFGTYTRDTGARGEGTGCSV